MAQYSRNAPCPCGSGEKHKRCCLARSLTHGAPQFDAESELLAVLMPTRNGQMSIETHMALWSNSDLIPMLFITESRLPVVDARNSLAQKAVDAKRKHGMDINFVLWIDDDAWWPAGTISRMLATLRARPDLDMLAAYFSDRMPFCAPGQFRIPDVARYEGQVLLPHDGVPTCWQPGDVVFTPGDIVDVDITGFHFVLMRIGLLECMGSAPFAVPRGSAWVEDFSFCLRARELGAAIACDTAAIVAHVDIDNGMAFAPYGRPGKIDGNQFVFLPDPRTNEEIQAEWVGKNIRADRRYGGEVDAIVQKCFESYRARMKGAKRTV